MDGLYGCYRGLSPRLVGNLLSTHFSERIADRLGLERVDEDEKDDLNDDEYYERFRTQLKRNVVVHAAGAIISSPFHVISIRMMAQFIGRETKYTSIFGSIVQIYKDEGILGFFSGTIPRLLFDVTCVVIASTATYMVGRHFIREKEGRAYFASLSSVRPVYVSRIHRLNFFLLVHLFQHFLSVDRRFNVHGRKRLRVSCIHIAIDLEFLRNHLLDSAPVRRHPCPSTATGDTAIAL